MDTSEQYIKMCDCPEIDGHWKPQYGDWVGIWAYPRPGIKEIGQRHIIMPNYPSLMRTLSGIELCRSDCLWLPRQDQIQEMMGCIPGNHIDTMSAFMKSQYYYSLEQQWLAFYMHKKYKKIWDGEKWVA